MGTRQRRARQILNELNAPSTSFQATACVLMILLVTVAIANISLIRDDRLGRIIAFVIMGIAIAVAFILAPIHRHEVQRATLRWNEFIQNTRSNGKSPSSALDSFVREARGPQ